MQWLYTAFAVLLILVGGVWILQGINLLPGSFMTGQIEWAIAGSFCAALGVAIAYRGRRRSKESQDDSRN